MSGNFTVAASRFDVSDDGVVMQVRWSKPRLAACSFGDRRDLDDRRVSIDHTRLMSIGRTDPGDGDAAL